MQITQSTEISVIPGKEYRCCSDGSDATVKERRTDGVALVEVHGSPVSDGVETVKLVPLTNAITVTSTTASYPFYFTLVPYQA